MFRLIVALVVILGLSGTAFSDGYQRDVVFKGWPDENRDCMNLRHELLVNTAIFISEFSTNGCLVLRGSWFGPYTNQFYGLSKSLDIDHLVPLKWAWDHGAGDWDSDQWFRFGTDVRFLIPVQSSANRSKGSKWPVQWLPSNEKFHCQYVLKFARAINLYGFVLSEDEDHEFRVLKSAVCALPSVS